MLMYLPTLFNVYILLIDNIHNYYIIISYIGKCVACLICAKDVSMTCPRRVSTGWSLTHCNWIVRIFKRTMLDF